MIFPGNIANPTGINGTTKSKPISDALRILLTRKNDDPLTDKPTTKAQGIALVLIKKAEDGDINAVREITDRVEGKAAQSLEIKKEDPYNGIETNDILGLVESLARRLEEVPLVGETGISKKKARTLPPIH